LLELQENFLLDHLLRWVETFAVHLEKTDALSCFYPTFATLVSHMCKQDASLLKELRIS
jgi:TorA maturation chaperone TorD